MISNERQGLIEANRWALAWRGVLRHFWWAISAIVVFVLLSILAESILAGVAPGILSHNLSGRAVILGSDILIHLPFSAFAGLMHHYALTFANATAPARPKSDRLFVFVFFTIVFAIFQAAALQLLLFLVPQPTTLDSTAPYVLGVGAMAVVALSPLFFLATMFPAIMAGGDVSAGAALRRGGFVRLFTRLLGAALVFGLVFFGMFFLVGTFFLSALRPQSAISAAPLLSDVFLVINALVAVYFVALIAVTISQHYAEREAALSARAQ